MILDVGKAGEYEYVNNMVSDVEFTVVLAA
jgi:hypothetical protein